MLAHGQHSAAPSDSNRDRRSFLASGMAVVWAIALAKLLFHIYFNNRYGYFRDEFDYMSCGDHLQWGYVDQPPLIPFLIHICRVVLGDSLRSVRFIPALASSLLVVQTAVLGARTGRTPIRDVLSAICAVVVPQYLSNGSLLGTNCLEPNLWMGCAYFAILAIKRNDPRYWLWFGVVAGVGMEEKYSIAVFGLGIVVGLLLTEQRRVFLDKWIWLGGLAAFLIFLPNLLWNIHYDWPFVQLIHNIKADGRDVVLGPAQFLWQQTPAGEPTHLADLAEGIVLSSVLGAAQALPRAGMVLSGLLCRFLRAARQELLPCPVYPMLLAAGAVVIEGAIDGRAESRAGVRRSGGGACNG